MSVVEIQSRSQWGRGVGTVSVDQVSPKGKRDTRKMGCRKVAAWFWFCFG